MRRAFILTVSLMAMACTAPGSPGAGASAGPSAKASSAAAAMPSNWPPGVPPPPTPKPGPAIGPSEKGANSLAITYTPPHLVFTATGVPAGTFSVIYIVTSERDPQDTLQIDSVDPDAAFAAKLEYGHLKRGNYQIRCFAKNVPTPLDIRTITVP